MTLFLESCSTSERVRSPEPAGRRGEGMLRTYAGLCLPLLRPAFFGCIVLCIALAWLPGSVMVRTGAGGKIEHAMAYLGLAIISSLAYRERPRLLVQFLLLVAVAGILEVGQLSAAGRQSSFFDFAASSTGAAIGGLLMGVVRPRLLGYLGIGLEPDRQRRSKSDEAEAGGNRLEPISGSSGVAGASLSLAQGSS